MKEKELREQQKLLKLPIELQDMNKVDEKFLLKDKAEEITAGDSSFKVSKF